VSVVEHEVEIISDRDEGHLYTAFLPQRLLNHSGDDGRGANDNVCGGCRRVCAYVSMFDCWK
jgi:hypothetical protein